MALLILGAAVALKFPKKRVWVAAIALVSVSVHLSALIPAIMLFVVSLRKPSIRVLLVSWFVVAFLYVTGMNGALLGGIAEGSDRLGMYTGSNVLSGYQGGANRLDFLAVSAFSIALIMVLAHRWRESSSPEDRGATDFLTATLILFNIYFLCFGFIAFSDRLAAYSWFLVPLALGHLFLRCAPRPRLAASSYAAASLIVMALSAGWPEILRRTPISG